MNAELHSELAADAQALERSPDAGLSALGKRISGLIERRGRRFGGEIAASLLELGPAIRDLIGQRKAAADKLLNLASTASSTRTGDYLDAFGAEIVRQASVVDYQAEDEDDTDPDADVAEDREPTPSCPVRQP